MRGRHGGRGGGGAAAVLQAVANVSIQGGKEATGLGGAPPRGSTGARPATNMTDQHCCRHPQRPANNEDPTNVTTNKPTCTALPWSTAPAPLPAQRPRSPRSGAAGQRRCSGVAAWAAGTRGWPRQSAGSSARLQARPGRRQARERHRPGRQAAGGRQPASTARQAAGGRRQAAGRAPVWGGREAHDLLACRRPRPTGDQQAASQAAAKGRQPDGWRAGWRHSLPRAATDS